MSFITKLLRRDKNGATETSAAATVEAPPCPHTALTARWDSVQDMGIEAKATSFVCSACNEEFTPERAAELRATERSRLRPD